MLDEVAKLTSTASWSGKPKITIGCPVLMLHAYVTRQR